MSLLSIDFIAKLQAKAFQSKPELFWITTNRRLDVLYIAPVKGSFDILQTALESDYLSPWDRRFWQAQEFPRSEPASETLLRREDAFFRKYIHLQRIDTRSIKKGSTVEIQIKDRHYKRVPIRFRGVVTDSSPNQPAR
jgi:hypothetical protein